jgi:hypothetical protein
VEKRALSQSKACKASKANRSLARKASANALREPAASAIMALLKALLSSYYGAMKAFFRHLPHLVSKRY